MVAHGVLSGTDTSRPWMRALYAATIAAVVAATFWRAFVPPPKPVRRQPAARAADGEPAPSTVS